MGVVYSSASDSTITFCYKMAALEMPANGEASHSVGEDIIHKALDSVEDRQQKVPHDTATVNANKCASNLAIGSIATTHIVTPALHMLNASSHLEVCHIGSA